MKNKALFTFIVFLVLTLIMTGTVSAASYDYTVTVDGGLYGTVTGTTPDTFAYGEEWNPNDYTVTVTNSKYYFKGFHRAGHEGVLEGAQEITEDVDFVATFGIKGTQVKYVVNFVDEAGNPLAPSKEFYGNVGDKPVVAYVYIEGFQPQAYNLTKTLSEDETLNVFTFTYSEETPIQDNTIVPGEGEGAGGGTAGGGGAAGGGTGGGTGGGAAGGGTGGGTEGEVIDDGETPETDIPDVIDLDDDDTPLSPGGDTDDDGDKDGDGDDDGDGKDSKTPVGVIAGAGAGVLAAIIAALAFFRKKKDEEDDDKAGSDKDEE